MTKDKQREGHGEDDMTRFAGWDALADDIFGLNVRGFRTMWVSVFNPARVFEAARDPDWLGRYTPAIRLTFVIIAAAMALQFLWTYEGSPVWNTVEEAVRDFQDELQGRAIDSVIREVLLAYAVLYPLAYFALHIPLSLLAGTWGKGVPMPVRSRLYFAALVPASIVSLIVTIGQNLLPADAASAVAAWALLVIVLTYFAVIFRGLAPRLSAPDRLWRAGLMAVIMISASALAEFIGLLAASIYVLGTPSVG